MDDDCDGEVDEACGACPPDAAQRLTEAPDASSYPEVVPQEGGFGVTWADGRHAEAPQGEADIIFAAGPLGCR